MRTGAALRGSADLDLPGQQDKVAILRDLPALIMRARQLLELAELAAKGPDPESLLPDVAELRRACDVFLRTHG